MEKKKTVKAWAVLRKSGELTEAGGYIVYPEEMKPLAMTWVTDSKPPNYYSVVPCTITY